MAFLLNVSDTFNIANYAIRWTFNFDSYPNPLWTYLYEQSMYVFWISFIVLCTKIWTIVNTYSTNNSFYLFGYVSKMEMEMEIIRIIIWPTNIYPHTWFGQLLQLIFLFSMHRKIQLNNYDTRCIYYMFYGNINNEQLLHRALNCRYHLN